jgi:hypothetical protein
MLNVGKAYELFNLVLKRGKPEYTEHKLELGFLATSFIKLVNNSPAQLVSSPETTSEIVYKTIKECQLANAQKPVSLMVSIISIGESSYVLSERFEQWFLKLEYGIMDKEGSKTVLVG